MPDGHPRVEGLGRRRRIGSMGVARPYAILEDEEPIAIRAFDPPLAPHVEKHAGMAQLAAVTGDRRRLDLDRLGGWRNRTCGHSLLISLESRGRCHCCGRMIPIARQQSTGARHPADELYRGALPRPCPPSPLHPAPPRTCPTMRWRRSALIRSIAAAGGGSPSTPSRMLI